MDSTTLVPPGQAPSSPPQPRPAAHATEDRAERGLAAEVRESLMLLGFAVGATVGLTAAAQAVLALLA